VTRAPESPGTPDFFQRNTDARIEKVRSDIAGRLAKSCRDLPPDEFGELIDKMTRVQIGGEKRAR
jgi:hypothetical protein